MKHQFYSNPEYIDGLIGKMFADHSLRDNSDKNLRSFDIEGNHKVIEVMIMDRVFFVSLFSKNNPNDPKELTPELAYHGNDLATGLARAKRTCLSDKVMGDD
ncbi:hypothetical protein [Lactobacillus sp. Sy-1]|uniref:hypothetical protein n=1 Tax=Lactobacillus sp. Sy-1 TaxID=2109645 RepID=UPI001C5BA7C6|nr:hypothetical protein [Lactobacillus sp. Sy-1]MBW1606107.1 hypothetical protein [Lactobacillus sp. Sy-1]